MMNLDLFFCKIENKGYSAINKYWVVGVLIVHKTDSIVTERE